MAKSLFLYRKNSIFILGNLSENKKTGNMELIINATLLLAAIVLWIYGQYWRKKCGKVLCQYAAAYDEREDREKPLRQAIIAGNPHAPLLYALTCPELFDKVRPLRLFSFGSIRCVFA
ncbi:hypothetical protein NXW27_24180 [Phocaeicola dorei]|nr:hypothetical protein [Phocaeicola dorei]